MRMIGTVANEAQAQRFSDYLLAQRIDAHIEESGSGAWQVWVEHDDDLERASGELKIFVASPDDPRYDNAAAVATRARKEREKAAERRKRNYTDVRTSAAWSGVTRHGTPIAIAMIIICVLVAGVRGTGEDRVLKYMLFDASPPAPIGVTREGRAIYPAESMFDDIGRGQVWRVVTPIFGHSGIVHLLFNMMWLWRLGQAIEGVKGSLYFAFLVLAVAALSCAAEGAWGQFYSGWHGFVGMSGVNAGLFGYAWMKRKFQPYERISVTDQELGLMLGWLVICSFGIVGNIANAAHWGGLVVGVLIGVFPYLKRRFLRS